MFFATLFLALTLQSPQNCEIPWWISIQDAQDPCWTMERLRSQYKEAEEDVYFYRWLTTWPPEDLKFSRTNLNDGIIRLVVIEHPDAFMVGDSLALGVFRTGAVFGLIDVIEYSLKHEREGPIQVLRHEWGHLRELHEENKWTLNAFINYGWWHFGHGDFLDPLVKTVNHVKNWFYRGLPERHSYYPGQVGHEPIKGTPGSVAPPILPPISAEEQLKLFSNFKYHMEQHLEHEIASCILRPQ